MKQLLFIVFWITLTVSASAADEITPNHQVNPPHTFKSLVCVERGSSGVSGYIILINVPNGQDAEAKVYFNRPRESRSLIATWQVKYIVNPGVYAIFTNQFQKMDISRGFEDQFKINIQLHSGNGKNGAYQATFQNPALIGYTVRNAYEARLHEKYMNCQFQ